MILDKGILQSMLGIFGRQEILFVDMLSNKSEIAIRDLAAVIYYMFNIHANLNSTL